MNRAYIGKLLELAENDKRVCHLVADSGTGLDEVFKMNFPKQMYNFGIAENNMIGAAAGLAMYGEIPFVFTADAFLVYRSLEFIRDDVCLQNLNVKIIGMGSGLSWSTLGPTHHTTEAMGILRTLPNIIVLNPSTPIQVSSCVEFAYKHVGPVYIRIGMNNEKEFYDDDYKFSLNCNSILNSSIYGIDKTISIFSTGSIIEEVMLTKDMIENEGYGVNVVDCTSIKPLIKNDLLELIEKSKIVFTIEEHNVEGGFGTIISDMMANKNINNTIVKIGLQDQFAKSFGKLIDVRKANRLDSQSIFEMIRSYIE